MKSPIIPFTDRLVIRRLEAQEKKDSRIVIPDTAKEESIIAEILAFGPEVRLDVEIGDQILIGKYSGTDVECLEETFTLVREEECFGKVEHEFRIQSKEQAEAAQNKEAEPPPLLHNGHSYKYDGGLLPVPRSSAFAGSLMMYKCEYCGDIKDQVDVLDAMRRDEPLCPKAAPAEGDNVEWAKTVNQISKIPDDASESGVLVIADDPQLHEDLHRAASEFDD